MEPPRLVENWEQVAPSEPVRVANQQADAANDGGEEDPDAAALDILGEALQRPVVVPALEQEVTVARQQTTVGRSPSAVFVITQDMIRRSAARNIPEILRMAPGVHVARLDANKWAIGIRGFDRVFDDKLEVRIDGRSAYSAVFGGVNWDAQDLVLEDIERIEVIRGPGPSVYAANMNGIINIITKSAHDTQGGLAVGGGGTEQRGFGTFRYGGTWGNDVSWRLYGKGFECDQGFDPDDVAVDDWRQRRAGFRMDWNASCCDKVTFQGDYYDGFSGGHSIVSQPTPPFEVDRDTSLDISGGNAIVRWTHEISDDSRWMLQTFYDHTERLNNQESTIRDVFDVDFQYEFAMGDDHRWICGAQHRVNDTSFNGNFRVSFDPPKRSYGFTGLFAQDQITLREDELFFTVGLRIEQNDFTGFEYQPTGRLLWQLDERKAIWTSVSRAIRRPNRVSNDIIVHQYVPIIPTTTFVEVVGNPNIKSEDLLAYELGYRSQPAENFSWDVALFYNRYNNLETLAFTGLSLGPPNIVGLTFDNFQDVDTYGGELTATWQAREDWEMRLAYSLLQYQLRNDSFLTTVRENQGNASNIVYFHSSWDIACDWEFDAILRYVDSLGEDDEFVPHYITMDLRLAWLPSEQFEFAVVGRNLLDASHEEFFPSPSSQNNNTGTEVERSVYGTITYRW